VRKLDDESDDEEDDVTSVKTVFKTSSVRRCERALKTTRRRNGFMYESCLYTMNNIVYRPIQQRLYKALRRSHVTWLLDAMDAK